MSKQKLNYYRRIGSDGYRRLSGPVCTNRPIRQDYLDQFVSTRMALGARRSQVLGAVMRQGLELVLAGLGAGAIGAWWQTRLMQKMLCGVKPTDATPSWRWRSHSCWWAQSRAMCRREGPRALTQWTRYDTSKSLAQQAL